MTRHVFVVRYVQVAISLNELINRLRYSGICKEEFEPTDEILERIGLDRSRLVDNKLYRGRGCSKCRKTGYHGRTGIFEVMPITEDMMKLIERK